MGSYLSNQAWQDFQNYLPLRNRLTEDIRCKEEYVFFNDIQIHCDVYQPPYFKGTLILLHGLCGNGRLMSFLAVPFYRLGYRVICPDMPLLGYTQFAKEISYQDWIDSAKAVVEHYHIENTFLFGLSLGGTLAYQVAAACPYIQGIMATCFLDLNQSDVCNEILIGTMADRWLLSDHVPKLLQKKKLLLSSILNLDGICNNVAMLELLKKDPLAAGAKLPLRFLTSFFHPQLPDPKTYTVPVLCMHPQMDRWIDFSYSQQFYEKIQTKKRLVLIEGAGHLPMEAIGLSQLQLEMLKFMKEYCE